MNFGSHPRCGLFRTHIPLRYMAGLAISEIFGLQFLDPKDHIFLRNGVIDYEKTLQALEEVVVFGRRYVNQRSE
jgi:hypothetical protein